MTVTYIVRYIARARKMTPFLLNNFYRLALEAQLRGSKHRNRRRYSDLDEQELDNSDPILGVYFIYIYISYFPIRDIPLPHP